MLLAKSADDDARGHRDHEEGRDGRDLVLLVASTAHGDARPVVEVQTRPHARRSQLGEIKTRPLP